MVAVSISTRASSEEHAFASSSSSIYSLQGFNENLSIFIHPSSIQISAPSNGSYDKGHVRVYKYDGSTWTQLGQDINGEADYDESGFSVSLSSDGTIVAIGAIRNDAGNFSNGHVRIYEYNQSTNTWSQLGQDLDGAEEWSLFGFSTSLSSDGFIVAIGAKYHGTDGYYNLIYGQVCIYQYDSSANSWNKLGQDIKGENDHDYSGHTVSLSRDGSIVAIGAVGNDDGGSSSGHVRVYEYSSNTWSQLGQDIDGEAAGDDSGTSVSIF